MAENKKYRKQRTRLFAQISGLADKAGILTSLEIPATIDLQTDGAEAANLAATLYGMFLHIAERLEGPERDLLISSWRLDGKAKFKDEKENLEEGDQHAPS
ncbi:conjugal transfer protein TraD [Candidatus Terasakiella magnetica]|uniref:conjugal transfer protein TraD n=1 Tax=Candidatus Terasakiella magnetica TaxID=1867952 RepID=UPI001969FE02|nr:conjugal transfer protein TraD [Candidatus Terasakiella magnetica]